MQRQKSLDLCTGSLLSKVLLYTLPLIATGILQLLFNAADVVVVGRYAGHNALAAVSSTSALINLLVNVFAGLSVGVLALVARCTGAQDERAVHESVHTAMSISILVGIAVSILGFFACTPLLRLMGNPETVIGQSSLYMRIYFLGMPAFMIYNFGASILRAVGDTKRPLLFLSVSGILNVALNLLLVIVFEMGVAGVAIATVASQCLSAVLVVLCLLRETGAIRLQLSCLRIYKTRLLEILRIGLPAGLQGSVFSISNVLIQSSVNGFGSLTMAGNGAASNIEGFIYTAMNSFSQAALAFAGQNLGAKQPKRITQGLRVCLLYVFLTGLLFGGVVLLLLKPLLGLYSTDPEVIALGCIRLQIFLPLYFLCGMMDVFAGQLRGMGYSTVPMITSMVGACGLRIVWIYTVFAASPTLLTLYLCYPVSWTLTLLAHAICYLSVRNRVFHRLT